MKHRIIPFLLAIVLLISSIPAVSAADHGYVDIVDHWAEEDILWTMEQGLFMGTSDSTFDPEGTMTRGMFVTVLGRFAAVDPGDYDDWYLPNLFTDLNSTYYYAPYVNWAAREGITRGSGVGTFAPESPVTREQMAVLMVRFAELFGYTFQPIREDVTEAFADIDSVSDYAREAVEVMRQSGLLTGRLNGEGTFDFDPAALAARSECAAVFRRLMASLTEQEEYLPVYAEEVRVSEHELHCAKGDSFAMACSVAPENVSNHNILWVSSDPSVAGVDGSGNVTCYNNGSAEIYAYTANGLYDYCTVDVDVYIGYDGESYESKCMNVFGEVVKDHRRPYGNDASWEDYERHVVTVEVQVWDFKKGSKTEKVTKTMKLNVHENLAATVEALFAEIYACEEQYPINALGGQRRSTKKSEHTPGLAIDINANQNAYFDNHGNLLTGKYFDPENDEYSFEVGGEVEQIFKKYGFKRGIYWKNGYKDYMHFSFFGT